MEKLTKGIRAKTLLCINKMGIREKSTGNISYLSMTGKGPNIPICKKFDNSRWIGE